jgi:hypothetical protein
MSPYFVLAACLTLAACGTGARTPYGHFSGTVTPAGASGPPAPVMLCQGVTRGELDLAHGTFDFAPNEGTLVLNGRIDAQGALAASASQPGGQHRPYTLAFQGQLTGDRVTGTLTTPECRAAVDLHRN